jgi:O-antigen/teichoic acid export membrane protein
LSFKQIFSGSVWGILAKILDAFAKFFTIPLLVGHYGKLDYALIALAFSLNAYLRLMDMGMNIGAIRFFSIWLSSNELDKVTRAFRTNLVFYSAIGIINAFAFLVLSKYPGLMFDIDNDQKNIYSWIMYILAISTILNWLSSVVNQLLNAYGEVAWIHKLTILTSFLAVLSAFTAIHFELSLPVYFLLYTISYLIVIPINIYRLKLLKVKVSKLLIPGWDSVLFKQILNYSLAIFAMGVFQFTANNLRPLLLAKFASNGLEVLTDYRVLQTLTALIIAFGGVFMQVLLPSASKMHAQEDKEGISKMVYNGTKYISSILAFIVFMMVANSKSILYMYMGPEYLYLTNWLIVWLLTVLLSMHNTPIASLVLSTGKTRFLVYSSAFSCIASLPVTMMLAGTLNVGAAIIGYAVYVMIQIGCYYFHYIPNILRLNSTHIFFRSFMPSFLTGFIACLATMAVDEYILVSLAVKYKFVISSCLFSTLYLIFIIIFVLNKVELQMFKNKIIGRVFPPKALA